MWALSGFVLSGALTLAACRVCAARRGALDELDRYGLDFLGHARYATLFSCFAAGFLVTLVGRSETLAMILFAPLALAAIFYGATFVRGAVGEDE